MFLHGLYFFVWESYTCIFTYIKTKMGFVVKQKLKLQEELFWGM